MAATLVTHDLNPLLAEACGSPGVPEEELWLGLTFGIALCHLDQQDASAGVRATLDCATTVPSCGR
jgi:hypothetical protein